MKQRAVCLQGFILFAVILLWHGHRIDAAEVTQAAIQRPLLPLASLFDDRIVANNVVIVRDRAEKLPDTERYEFLTGWVLPGERHSTLRMTGVFTQTDPAPVNQVGDEHKDRRGGVLVSPVFDLLDLAKKTGRLPELLERVKSIPESRQEDQRRAFSAMLVLLHLEMGQQEDAEKEADQLRRLVAQSIPVKLDDMWPETLVVDRGMNHFGGNTAVTELLDDLFAQRSQRETPFGVLAWHNHIAALAGRNGHLETTRSEKFPVKPLDLKHWIPVSRIRSSTRGLGLPQARWAQQQDRVDKISGHDEDYLFCRSPLSGHYEVQCDISHSACQAMVMGTLIGSDADLSQIWVGTFRDGAKKQSIENPFSGFGQWVRYRCVVRDNVATTYLNGLSVRTEQVASPDPWVAVRSWSRSHASTRDLRIVGNPVIPEVVGLSASPDLCGWYSYHDETVGTTGARWEHQKETESTGQIFGQANAPQGSYFESLLVYQRPLENVGSVDYQFLYKAGVAETHPALDRMAFVLTSDGVRIHWITDSQWDTSDLSPDNLFDEPANRRGPAELPLKPDAWNQMTVAVDGVKISLRLNGILIYEGTLDISNRRTFGLFHFADQSEVRVRNVTMRGNWPKTLPPTSEQELADPGAVQLDADLPKLKAVFRHDFGTDGLPPQYFLTANSNQSGTITAREDGVFIVRPGEGTWTDCNIRLPFMIHGDFDIEASFNDLKIHSDGDASLMMAMQLDDEHQHECRMLRIRTAAKLQQLHDSLSVLHKEGGRSYASSFPVACEAMQGRLRMARRGELVHFLFAENDSEVFRLFATESVSDKPSVSDALILHTLCHGSGKSQVLWKSLTVRAERLTLKPTPGDRPPINLYAMNPDGTNLRMLAAPLEGFNQIGSVEWSADGTRLVGDMSDGSVENSRVIIMNHDGSGLLDLGPGCMPSLSPSNSEIVFSQPSVGIIRMKADGSGRKLLEPNGWGSQWSPDGRYIAWASGNNIVLLDFETNKRRMLMTDVQAALLGHVYGNFSWSHDSRSIAFKARSSDRTNTFVIVADANAWNGFRRMYSGPDQIMEDITWHPDGKRVVVAVVDQTTGLSKLILINRDSPTTPEQLPGLPTDWTILGSDWSPDGHEILFSAHSSPQPVDWQPTVAE